jgi:hypothetical protein
MRTFFEPDDQEGFAAGSGELSRRVAEWSRLAGGQADPFVVTSALEYRHRGTVDGRLGLWQLRHVGEFLLDWLPRTLTERPDGPSADGPGGLRALLRYLDASGLADPRGDSLLVLEQAVDRASEDYPAAMADRSRWGVAKFWATTAAEQGVDIVDRAAMTRFIERAQRGQAPYDRDALEAIMDRHQRTGPPLIARAEPQLPIALPGEAELRDQAALSPLVRQLTGLVAWAGPDGRELTKLGRLKLNDARGLVHLLETGDRPGSPRTSADLPRLNLLFAWAKQARLVRAAKGRLYQVAKARPLLQDPLALWSRAFEALFELREPLLGGSPDAYTRTSMLYDSYEDVLPDVLNTLYSLPCPMPWPRLRDSVHLAYRTRFDLGGADLRAQRGWLLGADHDLRHVLDILERLGAINRSQGIADPVFLDVPALDLPAPPLPAGMPPELAQLLLGALPEPDPEAVTRAEQLRTELAAGPVELIQLTDLATHAVRSRLLAEGRDAPLIGELAHAPAAGLLGVLAEHYDPDSARAELALWTDAHGGTDAARENLLHAVRATPFRSRAEAMLDVLVAALPEPQGELMLRSLRGDPTLAPTAISVLTRHELLNPDDVTEAEAPLMVAEGLLQLLENLGEEATAELLLAEGAAQARTAVSAALASGHPDHEGLDRLQHLADGPLRGLGAQLGRLSATRARQGRAKPTRKRRR